MKKILIVGFSLKVGGVERALVEQLKVINYNEYQADLFLFSHFGPYLSDIPKQVNLLPENCILKYYGLTQKDAKQSLVGFFVRSCLAIIAKKMGTPWLLTKLLRNFRLKSKYDIAISYFHNGSLNSLYCGCNELVLDCVDAKKKIAWVHSDYIVGKIHNEYNDLLYKKFDAVVNVSHSMKDKFDRLDIIPKSKSFVVYNRYDFQNCIQKASEPICDKPNGEFNLVTVGRLEKEKGIDSLLVVAKSLYDKGHKFKWYFVGDGVLVPWCKEFVTKNNLKNNVILVGQKDNPYPYIAQSNVLVSGSLSETFGFSILEALTLNIPVVAYKYEAVSELLNASNGIVCSSFDEMSNAISNLISNQKVYVELKNKSHAIADYNSISSEQFKSLMSDGKYKKNNVLRFVSGCSSSSR